VCNEVPSADLVLTSRISLFKEVEMIDCPEEMHSLASKGRAMTQASYNDIAQWYDQFLRERPVYTEVILPNW